MRNNVRIFISYSWDSEEHKSRVRRFVDRLRSDGLEVIYDGDIEYGDRITKFMEESVRTSGYVLYICTPGYSKKADERKSGVGYENTVITGELYKKNNERKFIPVLFEGDWDISIPYWSTGKRGFDYTDENVVESYEHFISRLKSNSLQGDAGMTPTQPQEESGSSSPDKGSEAESIAVIPSTTPIKIISKQKLIAIISIVSGLITILVFFSGKNFLDWFDQNSNQDQVIIEQLNQEINKLWGDYPIKSEFIKQLINTGIRCYNSGDYYTAGFYFERAIKEGDEGVTAKNNLAFMLRREEYISKSYRLIDLLSAGIEAKDTFAYINMALYDISNNHWDDADSYFTKVSAFSYELDESVQWWNKMLLEDDPEGYLVFALLARHRLIDYTFEISSYLDKAENKFGKAPEWMLQIASTKNELSEPTPTHEMKSYNTAPNNWKRADPPMTLADSFDSWQIEINDTIYSFPMAFIELEALGWKLADSDYAPDILLIPFATIKANFAYINNRDLTIEFHITNLDIDTRLLSDCIITGISITQYNSRIPDLTVIRLPGGIYWNEAKKIDFEKKWGEPKYLFENETTDYNTNTKMKYYNITFNKNYNEGDYYLDIWESGGIKSLSINNTVIPLDFLQSTADPLNNENIYQYNTPTSIGTDPASGIIRFEGILYQFPIPLKELVKNGWGLSPNTANLSVAGFNNKKSITIDKGSLKFDIDVYNHSAMSAIVENCLVHKLDGQVESKYRYIGEIVLPEDITFGMNENDLIITLDDAKVSYEIVDYLYSKDYIFKLKGGDKYDNGVRISISKDASSEYYGLVSGISINKSK